MKFKKIISAVLVFCLAASSALCVSADQANDIKVADVGANKKVDVSDALLVLQYSVGKFRKFPIHDYYNNVDGCLVPEYETRDSKDDVLNWLDNFKEQAELPVIFEAAKENGGFPLLSCNNPKYDKYRFEFYIYNQTAEYGEIQYDFSPSGKWGNEGIVATVVPADRRSDLNLESEFASAFAADYEEITKYGELKKGDRNGTEYLYWDRVDKMFYAGCIIKTNNYVVKIKILEESIFSESILDMIDFELTPLSQELTEKPLMRRYGDVNNDGKINTEDALMILQYAVGKIEVFS